MGRGRKERQEEVIRNSRIKRIDVSASARAPSVRKKEREGGKF